MNALSNESYLKQKKKKNYQNQLPKMYTANLTKTITKITVEVKIAITWYKNIVAKKKKNLEDRNKYPEKFYK